MLWLIPVIGKVVCDLVILQVVQLYDVFTPAEDYDTFEDVWVT